MLIESPKEIDSEDPEVKIDEHESSSLVDSDDLPPLFEDEIKTDSSYNFDFKNLEIFHGNGLNEGTASVLFNLP